MMDKPQPQPPPGIPSTITISHTGPNTIGLSSISNSSSSSGGKKSKKSKNKSKDKEKEIEPTVVVDETKIIAKLPEFSITSMKVLGETIGEEISDEIATFLSTDVSFRLKEVFDQCTTHLFQGHKLKLTTTIVENVMKQKNIKRMFGHSSGNKVDFSYIQELDLFVEQDEEIDVVQYALSNVKLEQEPDRRIASSWVLPNKITARNGKLIPARYRFPDIYVKYFIAVCKIIRGTSRKLFHILAVDLRKNRRINSLAPFILDKVIKDIANCSRKNGDRRHLLLELINAATENKAIDLKPFPSTDLLLKILIHCSLDYFSYNTTGEFNDDEKFREKSAYVLTRLLYRWGTNDELDLVLGQIIDFLEDINKPIAVHRGCIQLLYYMGSKATRKYLWPHFVIPSRLKRNRFKSLIDLGYFVTKLEQVESLKDALVKSARTLYESSEPDLDDFEADDVRSNVSVKSEDNNETECNQEEKIMDEIKNIQAPLVYYLLYDLYGDVITCRFPFKPYHNLTTPTLRPPLPPRKFTKEHIVRKFIPRRDVKTKFKGYKPIKINENLKFNQTLFKEYTRYQHICYAYKWRSSMVKNKKRTSINACAFNLHTIL